MYGVPILPLPEHFCSPVLLRDSVQSLSNVSWMRDSTSLPPRMPLSLWILGHLKSKTTIYMKYQPGQGNITCPAFLTRFLWNWIPVFTLGS